jgi:hypothetical protein
MRDDCKADEAGCDSLTDDAVPKKGLDEGVSVSKVLSLRGETKTKFDVHNTTISSLQLRRPRDVQFES